MSIRRTIVEVLYDKRSKYEVVRIVDDGLLSFGGADFYVFRDGEQVAGRYADLRDAIAWAERQGASARR